MVYAQMAELADARDSKSRARKGFRVRPSVWAWYRLIVRLCAMWQAIRITRLSRRASFVMLPVGQRFLVCH